MSNDCSENSPLQEGQVASEDSTTEDARTSLHIFLPKTKKKVADVRTQSECTLDRYRIRPNDGSTIGHAVIINNEHFHWSTGMNQRRGTDADERNLVRIFQKLNFEVSLYKDVSKSSMLKLAENFASSDHSSHDCFIMAFLSHGDDGVIFGTDGTIKIKLIVDLFRGEACPTLAGKPKIFFFQACRGSKHEIGVEKCDDIVDGFVENEVVLDSAVRPMIPSGSDFLFCYSVAEGFYSHRDTLYGSWYVQALAKVFEEEMSNKGDFDILELLTLVNQVVSLRSVEKTRNPDSLGKKQMPCFLSMLTKKLFFSCKH